MTVLPVAIIDQFNVPVDIVNGDLQSHVDAFLEPLLHQTTSKLSDSCVIPAVTARLILALR